MDAATLSQQVVEGMKEGIEEISGENLTIEIVPTPNGDDLIIGTRIQLGPRGRQVTLSPGYKNRVTSSADAPHHPDVNSEMSKKAVDYRLRDVAQLTGLSEQYILNLVDRHQLIQPEKTGAYGQKQTYRFSADDLAKLRRVKQLSEAGRPIREVAHLIEHDTEYQQVAANLAESLIDLLNRGSFDEVRWQGLVRAFSQIPALTQQESEVLMLVEAQNRSLAQCAAELSRDSERDLTERDVRVLLDSANTKLGSMLLYLLRLASVEG